MQAHCYGPLAAVAIALAGLAACSRTPRLPECEKQSNKREADQCYTSAAERRQTPELCAAIGSEHTRATCFASCGESLGRSDLCLKSELSDPAGRCLAAIALKRQDPAVCELIVSHRRKDECLEEVAQRIRSIELCSKIVHLDRRFKCQMKLASQAQNPALCAQIGFWAGRDECLLSLVVPRAFSGATRMPATLCERIQSPEKKASCYLGAASQDPLACEHVGDSPQSVRRLECYRRSMEHIKTRAACSTLPDSLLVDECLARVGTDGQPALCGVLKDSVMRDACWSGTNQVEMCRKVQSRSARRYCVRRHWRQAEDPSLCDLLDGADRRDCRAHVAFKKSQASVADARSRKGK